MKKLGIFLIGLFVLQSFALALPKGKVKVILPGGKMGKVTFNVDNHKENSATVKKNGCKACHPKLFATKKKAAEAITQADHNKDKFCFTCHKEKGEAFAAKGNCTKCHAKGGKTEVESES